MRSSPITRIDFHKYGRKISDVLNSEKSASVVEGLPKNIYCDLVQTLNTKCIQISLLGKKNIFILNLGDYFHDFAHIKFRKAKFYIFQGL